MKQELVRCGKTLTVEAKVVHTPKEIVAGKLQFSFSGKFYLRSGFGSLGGPVNE